MRFPIGLSAVVATAIAGSASAVNVYVATGQSGAQTFINRTDISYWTFATNASAVSDFTGGYFHVKKGGGAGPSANINFAVIVGTYTDFTNNYNGTTGVYSGGSVISDSKTAGAITGSFTSQVFAGTPVTLAANTTYTAVVWSAATGTGNDTYYIKNNGDMFWSDSSGNAIAPSGYTPGQDLATVTSSVVPGAGLAALAGVGLAARRRRR